MAEDLPRAADLYAQAAAGTEGLASGAALVGKRCIALALMGDIASADQELARDCAERPESISDGSQRARLVRNLARAVIDSRQQDGKADRAALRRFLVRQCDLRPYEQLRRETFELQMLCAELLLRAGAAEGELQADSGDLRFLVDLLHGFRSVLAQHEASQDLSPFLRRFYGMAIETMGDADPDLAAKMIAAMRGPGGEHAGDDQQVTRVLFHLNDNEGLAVVVPHARDSQAFVLPDLGRREIRQRRRADSPAELPLPDALQGFLDQVSSPSDRIEYLWSDGPCWPLRQRDAALTPDDFPFALSPRDVVR
jgi:hypothetical protein